HRSVVLRRERRRHIGACAAETRTRSDADRVHSPTRVGVILITAQPPAELIGLAGSRRRQEDYSRDKASGITAPASPACQWITVTRRYVGDIRAAQKSAACPDDVGEGIGADLDFQHAAVVSIRGPKLQIIIVHETQERLAGGSEGWHNDGRRDQVAGA